MNILLLLTPKTSLTCLNEDMSIRQALEKMRAHSFTIVPLLKNDGEYLGSISEGDLLYAVYDSLDLKELEETSVKTIVKEDFMKAVKVDASMEEVLEMIMHQNYVPVVDDRNILMGIVTRSSIISHYMAENSL